MTAKTLAALLSLLLLASAQAGAQMYKYVAPDGKVTYSDRPPPAAGPAVQVFKGGVPKEMTAADAAAPALPAPAPSPSPSRTGPPGSAKHAIRQERGATASAEAASGPDRALLLPGIRTVLGNAALVRQAVSMCSSTLPTSARRYSGAEEGWKSRNGAVLARAAALVSAQLSGAERMQIEQAADSQTEAMLQPVRSAVTARRIAWCDQTANEIGSGRVDLAAYPSVRLLMQGTGP